MSRGQLMTASNLCRVLLSYPSPPPTQARHLHFLTTLKPLHNKAATILRLLGNEMIHFNTRGKKSEPDLRKQLNIEVKSTTKFKFFSLNILIYLYILLL